MSPPPIVTGISPKEGPPGTKITIRGEFLGLTAQDFLSLNICGLDCTLTSEWKSQNKIIARSGLCKGRGDIIVTTYSGGRGTSTVQFRGYHETIGPMKESAVWIEEAPVQSFVWGRRALSMNNYQQEDPLGLSVEGNDKKYPEDELIEQFGDASGELSSEKFHPGWFLLQRHYATTLDDLKAGLAYLRRKVNSQKESQLSFLKANVGSVIEQLDIIMSLKHQFETDTVKYGEDPMKTLEIAIEKSMTEANKLFDDVLVRRDKADSKRNALSLMQRYKFLFCMPINIEKNIKNGNYDLVINDYARIKNLFKNTEVAVFKKSLKEIEYRIETLREVLKKKLDEVPLTLDEQKKIVRNLINLDTEGDPSWDAIVSHTNYFRKSISSCANDYLQLEDDNSEGDSRKQKSNLTAALSVMQFKSTVVEENNIPPKVECLEALCDIVVEELPNIWKLGQSYFTGHLHINVNSDKHIQFKNLMLSNLEHVVKTMKLVYDANLEAPWLLHSLRCVRQLYASLIQIDLPNDALDIFEKFIFSLRLQCLIGLFKQTSDNIILLFQKETWQIQYLDEDRGITKLPLVFEKMVLEVAKLAQQTAVACGPREEPLLVRLDQQNVYHNAIQELFFSFTRCLKQLALIGSEDAFNEENKVNIIDSKLQHPIWEQCLLISLSNIYYTLNVILPRILKTLKSQGYPDMPADLINKADWTGLQALDSIVFERYLERRCDTLVGTIEPNMYSNGFHWELNSQPNHIKQYVQEIFFSLINIHAEVRHVSPRMLKRVLVHTVQAIAEEVSRLMTCVNSKFSNSGIIQARTDVLVLKETLEEFCTAESNIFFNEALDAIPTPNNKVDTQKIELLKNKVKSCMHLQLSCLYFDNNKSS